MTRLQGRWAGSRADRAQEGGYVAVMTALLLMVLMGLAAFAVDVGRWYVVGQQEQRAADAAALAGVPSLPGDLAGAKLTAQNFSKVNGFQNGTNATLVTPELDGGRPTRLRVTVSRQVNNIFGPLLGVPTTTVTRTAVADFGGPTPMGSPCNEFGNDPEPGVGNMYRSTNCDGTGQFWANVGTKGATKVSGDAYQDNTCSGTPDGCSGSSSGPNIDYDPNGYFYRVKLTHDVSNLTLQAFDPAWVNVGDTCEKNGLTGAVNTRYWKDPGSPFCTGDNTIGSSTPKVMATKFTVRREDPTSNVWLPLSYPEVGGSCTKVFQGYNGSLASPATLNQISEGSLKISDVFRQWVTLCSIGAATKGTYLIQVNSNGLLNSSGQSTDTASAHNRFGLRAYGASSSDNDAISISGHGKMAIYANLPNAITVFHLTRVPPEAKGQSISIRLFDIGDSTDSSGHPINGTITVLPPGDSNVGAAFSNCTGSGPVVPGSDCSIIASSTTHQGKWQTITVPIPANYDCNNVPTGCWLKLRYAYGPGAHPSDTTSWSAGIDGDPVRLVE
jgi:Flp pilus assembly protein TadG